MTDREAEEIRLFGIGGSPGICIGKAYLVDKGSVDVVRRYTPEKKDLKSEVKRFKAAVKKTRDELLGIIENTPEELRQHVYVFETHLQLLKDKMLYGSTMDTIEREHVNAEWALKKNIARIRSMFQDINDAYLKERALDIVHVGDRILGNLMGAAPVNLADINARVILVAKDLSPSETSQINLKKIKGFVTDRGGKTSHTSIIARTLEIPAVLGLENATRVVKNDDLLVVDGLAGILIVHPTEATLVDFEERSMNYEAHRSAFIRDSHLPATTRDGVSVQVLGNIEQPEEAHAAIKYGADGIGLYRTEFQYLSRANFPSEQELFVHYRDTVKALSPRPVTIRTLDINGDKAIQGANNGKAEENPALGMRAIRYCLKKEAIFTTQLRAILRAAAHGDIRILFPMISSIDEILAAKNLLQKVTAELKTQGVPYDAAVSVGVMIEVPAAVHIAEELAREVDFFSIGTNDLIQYTLAIDRNNKEVAYLYQPMHPAILRMLKHITQVAARTGTRVCICGEMAGEPLYTPVLLGLGVREFSLLPQNIPPVKSLLRILSAAETAGLAAEILSFPSARDVVDLLHRRYGGLLEDKADETPAAHP